VLDYHTHLWPHGERDVGPTIEQLAAYCERATAAGVVELAVTEHLFRFRQARQLIGPFWEEEPDERLARSMQRYYDEHARADLDAYVECALTAKQAGLPLVVGLEVDYYRGRMDDVARLLSGYPFDVLLGAVHWIGIWRFDDLDDPVSMGEWDVRRVDEVWGAYVDAVEELAATRTCDVLAHPDLVKVAGHRPIAPEECWERLVDALARSGMAAEVSSAGWRKPVGEQYPALGLLERLAAVGIPVTTASDAHRLAEVADRAGELRRLLASVGVTTLQAYRERRPRRVPLTPATEPGSQASALPSEGPA
jgi:histidinol-phosphatase (PHP family)